VSANTELNILIVDDVAGARKILRRLLSKLGYANCIEVDSATAALASAGEQQFQLIISDLMLADMKGYELCQEVRKLSSYSSIPFILVTGESAQSEKDSALALGVDGYLLKPYSVGALKEAIAASLAARVES